MRRIDELAQALAEGTTTSRALIEESLARIGDPSGEGCRVFIKVYAEQARAMADAADSLRRVNRSPGRYAGIPIALKDLFDVAGEPTPAGSAVLAGAPPAAAHAPAVARMLAAGFIPVGRANMTEFAFSGLGINPHYGTPAHPWDRETGRIPGGSSSAPPSRLPTAWRRPGWGRIPAGPADPAAFCGIVGYKPTARRIPITGVLPLAPSLDSVGPLAPSVACCATIDAILAGEAPRPPVAARLDGLRLAVPDSLVLDGMDDTVAAAFERALTTLSAAGARIEKAPLPRSANCPPSTPRAASRHRRPMPGTARCWRRKAACMTRASAPASSAARPSAPPIPGPRGRPRPADRRVRPPTAPYDCVLMPTVPIVPPPMGALEDEQRYNSLNMLILRNTALGNFFDRCAISVPCHRPGEAPVGLMLMGETMGDARLFGIAAAVERAFG